MVHKLSKDKFVYKFDKNNKPVLFVKDGDVVEVETADCFTDQITSEDYILDCINWNKINPATGPIFVENAQVGDILQVKIEKIDLNDTATMLTGIDMGVLGDELVQNTIKKCPIKDNMLIFSSKIKIPLNKMVGVIGTAPKDEAIACGTPDLHGGNMDCKEIKEGASIYLPVNVQGGLLALGDIHAAMGDGEVCVSGAEIGARVRIKIKIIKNTNLPTPLLVNNDKIMTISSKKTLDEACISATKAMVDILVEFEKLSKEEAIFLLSLQGDLQICQIVDPHKTVRMSLERKYFFNLFGGN